MPNHRRIIVESIDDVRMLAAKRQLEVDGRAWMWPLPFFSRRLETTYAVLTDIAETVRRYPTRFIALKL